jgi:hypothetical protein
VPIDTSANHRLQGIPLQTSRVNTGTASRIAVLLMADCCPRVIVGFVEHILGPLEPAPQLWMAGGVGQRRLDRSGRQESRSA